MKKRLGLMLGLILVLVSMIYVAIMFVDLPGRMLGCKDQFSQERDDSRFQVSDFCKGKFLAVGVDCMPKSMSMEEYLYLRENSLEKHVVWYENLYPIMVREKIFGTVCTTF